MRHVICGLRDYRVGCAAKIYGPAEDCYPAEDAEVDVTGISCKGEELETNDLYICIGGNYFWLDTIISDYICENIENMLQHDKKQALFDTFNYAQQARQRFLDQLK